MILEAEKVNGLYVVQVTDIGGTPKAITDINAPECVAAMKMIKGLDW